ncbi:type IV pilus modification PilV family protein [Thermus caldifontis]|uniref:type IV pilus modification PilV family protein n=1 Tax=Thermus caldifontis TaxID=1930763 RepID=UPI000DF1DBA5|nr:type II secretion system protein [Thermus caldifontis]
MRRQGLTLLETLIALAVLGIAFGALLMSQLSNLRVSAQSRYATDAKAAAVRVLEQKSAEVLKSEILPSPDPKIDDPQTGRSFYFVDYYYRCPTSVNPPPELRGNSTDNLRNVACEGEEQQGNVKVDWRIFGESGILGEGVVTIVVTAMHDRGPQVTIGRRVTCYDVYPSPTNDKPAPCPPPGGGRP